MGDFEFHGDHSCDVCGEPVLAGQEWLGLNRYLVGTGESRAMSMAVGPDGECLWHIAPDGQSEDEHATFHLMHWPICGTAWIDAKIAETRVAVRGQDDA